MRHLSVIASSTSERTASPAPIPAALHYSLQPIVDAHTGAVYGYEALLRGTAAAGFQSIDDFFDTAASAGSIAQTELELMRLAMATYRRLPHRDEKKLFLNIDGRVFLDPGFSFADVASIADQMGISRSTVTIELSEKQNLTELDSTSLILGRLRSQGLRIAVDDFGQGFSELKLLYDTSPEYVKIDRFFVNGIDQSSRKRLFVSTVANLAHTLGARVVAEGVETREEYLACRQAGCDLVQGWYIARPIQNVAVSPPVYAIAIQDPGAAASGDRSSRAVDQEMDTIEPVLINSPLQRLFQHFHLRPDRSFLPVVDAAGEPLGLVYERDLRAFSYSQFGRDILNNRAFGRRLQDFVVRAPVIDADCDVDHIVEAVASNSAADAVIVTRNLRYAGVLSSHAILKIVNERRIAVAQDQNPLSLLPGNASIYRFLSHCGEPGRCRRICYFDFNYFKPFNDTYGFRLGDRAIMLFADILRQTFAPLGAFLGHIGGDDFFAGHCEAEPAAFEEAVRTAITSFRLQIESFYEPEHRATGYLVAPDRTGVEQMYPIMTCSAAILAVPPASRAPSIEHIARIAADAKQVAKASRDGVVTQTVE